MESMKLYSSKCTFTKCKISFIFFFLLFAVHSSVFAISCDVRGIQKDAPFLCGNAIQGGFLFGQTDWNVTSSNSSATNKDGIFIIGLPMDAKDKLHLKFCKEKKSPKKFMKF